MLTSTEQCLISALRNLDQVSAELADLKQKIARLGERPAAAAPAAKRGRPLRVGRVDSIAKPAAEPES